MIPEGVVGYTGAIFGRKTLGTFWGLATLICIGLVLRPARIWANDNQGRLPFNTVFERDLTKSWCTGFMSYNQANPDNTNKLLFTQALMGRYFGGDGGIFQSMNDCPASYHAGSGALSFADGHSEIHRWRDQATLRRTSQPLAGAGSSPNDYLWMAERTTGPK